MGAGDLEVLRRYERVAVPQRRLPAEQFVAGGVVLVVVMRRDRYRGAVAYLVRIGEIALGGDYLAVGDGEVVVGLVVAVSEDTLDLGVVEPGDGYGATDKILGTNDSGSGGGQ